MADYLYKSAFLLHLLKIDVVIGSFYGDAGYMVSLKVIRMVYSMQIPEYTVRLLINLS